ncbi:TlyA family RNA methyltransferase [Latilactobacillus sakei]|uniref:16S/23S rRNA (Cytidine-2'-O)-methyltransferase TlyA n=1 Tax=Latilactobacillus sakei TaxID=1599 RepID=A0A9N7PA67_LATSK|nr:TlyA family RNA methyltransferase [Latilactobacillus sakei]AST83223.1 TlyA family rRNA (cytidine-2'-O)-methyltransferase [Latilactobacillus sakei]AWZ45844.1 TlyA family rRNA (cytidine-2'-O)-methyltransferase [Latilactobacillus sakei]AYG16361.1 TlyA family rRNA (cytidine-2'-O)-methyltransferase [Latilactobacillus sakei]AYG25082.1 TlyA family rRNA (cytidine-2'-O)-methyltransferase [Latilactobacillus sakei]AYG30540.1 TlyA family rRNA (cytidine-2'-O)-methyltransferase [Latilactobacillus sakei]
MKKERVDVLLVQQGLFESREQGKRAIMAGEVYGKNDERIDKPGEKIDAETVLRVKGHKIPYVGRGALKLAKAIDVFDIDLKDKLTLDIGSSTGGFTDVALRNGARRCYALDVGYNQLAWKLREDPRVVVMERVNFRYSQPEDFTDGLPDFAMTDVSFISLHKILVPLKPILKPNCDAVALIKPQFEAGPANVGKNGIVRDPKVHKNVVTDIVNFSLATGYDVLGLDFSPIKGGEGNIEFLIHLRNTEAETGTLAENVNIDAVLERSYAELKRPSGK